MISPRARGTSTWIPRRDVTIDGKDANSLFDVHKQDGRVWITAKQSLLDTTYNQAADRKVRMTIKGAFTKGVLKAGQKVQLTNGDWEKWNQQTVPGNEPPVREWSPNPDKSWIKLGDDGTWQAVVDPDETNKTGADTQKFLDGDQVASVVNGVIASDLVKVTDIKLTDDYAKRLHLISRPTSRRSACTRPTPRPTRHPPSRTSRTRAGM